MDGCRARNCATHSKHLDTSSSILGGDVGDEVADTAGVTPLVIVPGDELDEVGAQLDSSFGVEDRRAVVTDEIGRDDLLIGVFDDALVFTLRGGLHDSLNLVIGSSLLGTDNEIDDRDIEGGDAESETTVGSKHQQRNSLSVTSYLRKFAIEGRNDLADGLSGTGGGRNDVVVDAASSTPVLVGGSVDSLLGGSRGMDSGHQALHDSKVIVNDLGEGGQAVGCARGIGDLN